MTINLDPDEVDVHVGVRMRARRKELRLSQSALAQGIGCTFQQVQKYERGRNRVAASALWRAAGTLGVEVGYFFEGMARKSGDDDAGDHAPVVFEAKP